MIGASRRVAICALFESPTGSGRRLCSRSSRKAGFKAGSIVDLGMISVLMEGLGRHECARTLAGLRLIERLVLVYLCLLVGL
ncbi:hypothetical protein OH76DRAFT_142958 [Lentinus brumalis]|uniref:Uncharacterized protein n=1 Tax=Lentinus brumalis TaxID=2498619 RepID=A0A371CPB6_9APHY|nr:hypothetical protein OH76DRAFT_142958 [Polyporus brumalis]